MTPPTPSLASASGARVMESEIDIDDVPFGSPEPTAPKRRNYFGERFSGRPLSLLESAAFSVLNLAEHKMLLRIEIEAGRHAGNDNGKWPVTFEQFEDCGIRRALIAGSRRALVALGIVVYRPGIAASSFDQRRPNLFGLTYRHVNSEPPVNTWRKIKDVDEAERIADEARCTKDDGGQRPHRAGAPIIPLAA